MYKGEEIIAFADKNKPVLWGLFLATIIFGYAVGNIFFGILAALFLVQLFQNKKFVFNRRLLPIVIYFLWGLVSLLWTTNSSNTISGIGLTFPLLSVPILLSQYSDFGIDDLSKTIKVFSTCLLLYFVVCFGKAYLLFLGDKQFAHFFYHDLVSIFDNNAIYISLAVAICILINWLLPNKKVKDYLIIFFLGIFLLLLSSKNIIITTGLLLFLTLLFLNKNKRKAFFIISLVLSFVAGLILISKNPIKDRFLTELKMNTNHIWHGQDFYDYKFTGSEVRLFQWRLMGEMIDNNQVGILGLGLHNVDYLIEQYFSYYNLYKGYFYINFHNQYLQTLGELGFIGLIFLVIIFIWSTFRFFKLQNNYGILSIVLFMVAFFTESFLSRQKGVYLFVIIYSLVSIVVINPKREEKIN